MIEHAYEMIRKRQILNEFLHCLQMTERFRKLSRLEYVQDTERGEEYVIPEFFIGDGEQAFYAKGNRICVTADSDVAMLKDILTNL